MHRMVIPYPIGHPVQLGSANRQEKYLKANAWLDIWVMQLEQPYLNKLYVWMFSVTYYLLKVLYQGRPMLMLWFGRLIKYVGRKCDGIKSCRFPKKAYAC